MKFTIKQQLNPVLNKMIEDKTKGKKQIKTYIKYFLENHKDINYLAISSREWGHTFTTEHFTLSIVYTSKGTIKEYFVH